MLRSCACVGNDGAGSGAPAARGGSRARCYSDCCCAPSEAGRRLRRSQPHASSLGRRRGRRLPLGPRHQLRRGITTTTTAAPEQPSPRRYRRRTAGQKSPLGSAAAPLHGWARHALGCSRTPMESPSLAASPPRCPSISSGRVRGEAALRSAHAPTLESLLTLNMQPASKGEGCRWAWAWRPAGAPPSSECLAAGGRGTTHSIARQASDLICTCY